jgi:hypothetical protein
VGFRNGRSPGHIKRASRVVRSGGHDCLEGGLPQINSLGFWLKAYAKQHGQYSPVACEVACHRFCRLNFAQIDRSFRKHEHSMAAIAYDFAMEANARM